jgi:hypothetical protein
MMFRAPITYRPAVLLGTTIVALQVADVLTTGTILTLGGYETNPIVGAVMAGLGPVWWLPKLGLGSVVAAWLASRPRITWLGWFSLSVSVVIVANNVLQISGRG